MTTFEPTLDNIALVDAYCYQIRDHIALSIIAVITFIISLSFILLIATIAIKQIHKLEKLNPALKALFYLIIISALIDLLTALLRLILCFNNDHRDDNAALILQSASAFGYMSMILFVLGTLLVRLYTTFQQSIYKMSNTVRNIFIILFSIMTCLTIAMFVVYSIRLADAGDETFHYLYMWIALQIFFLFVILYLISAIWAVYLFSHNLLALARSRVVTTRNVLDVKLSKQQQKLINMTGKYVSLFAVAGFSMILCIIMLCLEVYAKMPQTVTMIAFAVDCCVIVMTIYMQYSFASNYYEKYCGCIDNCCIKLLTRNMKQSMSNIKRKEYSGCPTTEQTNDEMNTPQAIRVASASSACSEVQ